MSNSVLNIDEGDGKRGKIIVSFIVGQKKLETNCSNFSTHLVLLLTLVLLPFRKIAYGTLNKFH